MPRCARNTRYMLGGRAGERVAQWSSRIDEGAPGQLQTHCLEHHLVRVCGAVKRTGSLTMVGGHLCFEERFPADLALSVQLSNPNFFLVGQP